MAKKLLAILLAVTLVFSLGVTAFAADDPQNATEVEIVPEPEQTDEIFFFSAKSDWIKPGKTNSIPVSIISKVTPEATPEWYFVTFTVNIGEGADYAAVTGFKFNESIPGFDKFKYVVNEDRDGLWTVSFAVKAADTVDFFNQQRLELGTVEVAVDESFPGGTQPVDVALYAESIGMINLENEAFWDEVGLYNVAFTGGFEYNDVDTNPWGLTEGENMFFNAAHCYKKLPWQDKLINTLKGWALDILDFFTLITNALRGLLQDA